MPTPCAAFVTRTRTGILDLRLFMTQAVDPSRGYRQLSILLIASIVASQPPAVRTLANSEATLRQPLLQILYGIRELSDGSLLLVDGKDRRAFRVDRELSRADQVGAVGSGPGEYLRPNAVFPLSGDTSAIRDGGSGNRLLLVTPRGTTGRFLPASGLATPRDARVFPSAVDAVDGSGNYYATVRPSMVVPGNRDSGDTLAIVRWSPRNPALKLIAFLPTEPRPSTGVVTVSGMRVSPDASNVPFWSKPQWAVSLDGRIAVAHHTPYRVELFDSTGRRIADTRPASAPVRVTEGHKKEWLDAYNAREEEDRRRFGGSTRPPAAFPQYLPAFLHDALHFDPSGRLWIHKTTAAGAPATFDVIDTRGRVSFRVMHTTAARLAGFGSDGAVYFARPNADGFEHLERYRVR